MNVDASTSFTKKELRKSILTKILKQTEQQREDKSKKIERRLLGQEEFTNAKRIMFYLAIGGEVNTENMINEAFELGKEIYVPVCDTKNRMLSPCRLDKKSVLKDGPYRTREPQIKVGFPATNLDLVIVPALAYDTNGNRLGRGKGYYDRFLEQVSTGVFSIGLAFDFQIVPNLPISDKDVPVDRVLFV